MANDSLNVGGVSLAADLIMAMTEARCASGKAAVTGSSIIAGLTLNGQPINVTGKPNQTIQLPLGLGQLVINEQVKNVNGRAGSISVNAIHLTVTGVADVILGHAESGIPCGKPKDDTIRVRLSNGYDTGVRKLTGASARTCGNIRMHKACK